MYEKEVAKGAAWLDRMEPGWYKAINLGMFTLENPDVCSLGQTLGGNVSRHLCNDIEFSATHGFNLRSFPRTEIRIKGWIIKKKVEVKIPVPLEQRKRDFSILTAAWIQEILRRREKDRLTVEAQAAAHAE